MTIGCGFNRNYILNIDDVTSASKGLGSHADEQLRQRVLFIAFAHLMYLISLWCKFNTVLHDNKCSFCLSQSTHSQSLYLMHAASEGSSTILDGKRS